MLSRAKGNIDSVQIRGTKLLNRVLVNEGMKTSYYCSGFRSCLYRIMVTTCYSFLLSVPSSLRTMAGRQRPLGSQKNLRKAGSPKKRNSSWSHRNASAVTGRRHQCIPCSNFQPSLGFSTLHQILGCIKCLSLYQPELLRGKERGCSCCCKKIITPNLSPKLRRKQGVL